MTEQEIREALQGSTSATITLRGSKVYVTDIRFLLNAIGFSIDGVGEHREGFYDIDKVNDVQTNR